MVNFLKIENMLFWWCDFEIDIFVYKLLIYFKNSGLLEILYICEICVVCIRNCVYNCEII